MSEKKGDGRQIHIFLFIFAIAHAILLSYYCAWPLYDTIFIYPNYTGNSVNNVYSLAWFILIFFVVMNIVLLYMLFGALADLTSASRVDLHFITTIGALVVNILVVIIYIGYYFLYINTSYSGTQPFNDYLWCCTYYLDHPELCANTIACPIPRVLYPNDQFKQHWIFAGVFFFISLLNLGINRLLRKIVPGPRGNTREGKILAILFIFLYTGIFAYWCAWPLYDTILIYGYPLFGTPPSPGPFVNFRYSWTWLFLWFLVSNMAPPILFFCALLINKSSIATNTHFWLTIIVCLLSIASFIFFLCMLIFDCNYSWSGGSICNDYLWCCNYFANSPDICPNVTPCNAPNLTLNSQFLQHILFSLFFIMLSTVELWIHYRMIEYGIFVK